ncbi:8-oxo-dGTP pyrophosphatase MutT (NUDIX family) [Pullulanibacillus pueri]|uniref:Coenzyme A pyrophosphatase n=1 Tax=Pullulanibacillus pueri TaxID=1437324 RepID=A0A8J2ZZJ1_9BACL|nr:CoA pyrophosphatase [Pullulanibacillus pueri]MBM7680692.1 8-oxo-dGTP pyrophosphatase MutT (NUDIX family) [Pullulanibacillus pueri]GGH87520.1 coenzyme A pyrophosphatase [Pullulanibacillus pueri]
MKDLSLLKKRLNLKTGTGIIGEELAIKAGVLVPLIQKNDRWEVLFEVRSKNLKRQPGDICFPGGKKEAKDRSLQETAVRETSEELGIDQHAISVLGPLDRYIPSAKLIIYPFVGLLNHTTFNVNHHEVEEVFTIPLDWLLNSEPEKHSVLFHPQIPEDFPYDRIALGKEHTWRPQETVELFYHYKDYSVWGMTARILQHFIKLARP